MSNKLSLIFSLLLPPFDPFVASILKIDTSLNGSPSNTFILPLNPSGSYDFLVYWGDNSKNRITSWNQAETTHVYTDPGVYEVRIIGLCIGWAFAAGW